MGKARDGSECYTRTNNAGAKYVTCEGEQKKNRKLNREISKLHGRTRVKVTKDEFNEARAGLQQTIRRPPVLGGRTVLSSLAAQTQQDVGNIATQTTAQIDELFNAAVAEQPGVVSMTTNWLRSDTVRGQSRRAALARRLTTRPAGRIETGSINPGGMISEFDTSLFVSETPGVVAMTSTMSPLGQATFDALLGAGADVSKGISAAVADRNKVGFYNIVFRGKIGDTNAFDIQDAYNTAEGSWFQTNEGLSGKLTKAQVDDMKKRFPDIQVSEVELPPPIPQPVSVYQQRLKELGLDTDITGNEARLISEYGNEPTFISGTDDEFIEQILQAVGWSPDFAPLSAAQRKRLLSTRGKNNMFIKPNTGMGGVDQKNTRMIDISEFSEGVRGRVVIKSLPKIRLKYLG